MILSIPGRTLFVKEIKRFLTVWGQTVATPILSSFLYLFVFGYSLGRQISMIEGISYLNFIVPGLIMMGIINNSYQNTASSILISKFHGNIHDILVAPISYRETLLAYTLGAMIRGFLVGALTLGVSLFFTRVPFSAPLVIVLTAILTSIVFSQVGLIAAVFSKSFDQMSMITNYVLMPLTFLSGVFYSIQVLPPFWQKVSLFNPLLYAVDAFRFGFLGVSDIPVLRSFLIIAAFALLLMGLSLWILRSGRGLRK
jgi:ABC-2 type transport system permease protein